MAAPTFLVVTETKPGAATAAAPAAPAAPAAARVLQLPVMSGHHRHRAFLTLPAPSLRRLHYAALSADRRAPHPPPPVGPVTARGSPGG